MESMKRWREAPTLSLPGKTKPRRGRSINNPSMIRQLKKKSLCFLPALLALSFYFASSLHGETLSPSEYQVKAAFIYNFTKFIEWPRVKAGHQDETFDLCILGEDPFGNDISSMEEKVSRGKGFKIRRQRELGDGEELQLCDILFISPSEEKNLTFIIEKVKNDETLTISDIDGFAQSGGVIGFITKNNKVALAINPGAAERAGLKISSKLLKLAEIAGDQ